MCGQLLLLFVRLLTNPAIGVSPPPCTFVFFLSSVMFHTHIYTPAGSSSSKRGAAKNSSSSTSHNNTGGSSSGLVGNLLGGFSSSSNLNNMSLRPDLHISLDHVKPLKYELIGIGLVLLLGLPLSLNNKEFEAGLPLGLKALKGFGRASVKRSGYASLKLGAGEASGVLDLN